ncbi:N-acetylmuramoyl-L-alanine amidase [Pseudenhygromyxa sp. WMMC2535]|uniref:peptidoglycan recognition protein family protein n=1 Tax=Pseudenhygromyxa sp. WMMC2535 TaxID=2712867 RepID=UPI0015572D9C|nr:peptidoglycan recognition family protein [Pseudenhygromyxa sp. WMMC2535]NVB37229.1 N-acetylmuramoyl-L-alanine amidase [Pseudenhygromyxa sp. WMMC2535]NVB38203.1 N-acetylmuramoyl-L-alanine amidase [Pseudenhygromyxa sp. WMMC2535]NVB41602.1 N-acetylmuramoyl-L-alanine amidase [Pseudenhygromyxa sp. WMMC2535]NVB43460.1 N-acetylmuramoyl-L-alanine amidase [Pseudenhygromyxa sp. WMMC2535]NVB43558.1 N-acetylmuramoyl-L-alanine amidase [Pseudenhygromyxa sp. WMMC2535]
MLELVLGLSSVLASGVVMAWARARANTLEVVDLRAEAPASKRQVRKATVDAVVLHQTGFSRGLDPIRYRKVTAHFVVLPDGTVVQLHPVSARLSASNGFNSRSVAVEFVGNFRSVQGGWWKPEKYGRNTPSAAQIRAGRQLLRELQRVGVRYVFAHRQSLETRGNDPGPEIWHAVGQWAVTALGMSDGGPGYAVGTGAPIPDAWRRAPTLA